MLKEIEKYKIGIQIGKGSFGKVYKGIDKITNQEVALKFIEKREKRSRDIKTLKQQNELLKKINHPNVICLKDVLETSKQIIIVTDYAGRDLAGVIQEQKKFPLQKVKEYSRQILDAMLYLSQHRIIHRDLKPQNILIKDDHIKICDFGFAKKLSASTSYLQSLKGTPLYLAPEIIRQIKYTDKVDVWSFGCIIFQLYTGRWPYYANTYHKLAPLILKNPVPYPSGMPAQLKELIAMMLQKNPAARASWSDLKVHPFFKKTEPLQQKKLDNRLKQLVSVEIDQKQQYLESKIIQKLQNENQLENYLKDFKKIEKQLADKTLNMDELKKDILFLHKIKTILHERSQNNPLIGKELLELIFNILNALVKAKKSAKSKTSQLNPNQGHLEEDDITRNQTLIIGILCLAKVEVDYELLQKELKTMFWLIKANFNGIEINAEIDEEITEFVTDIIAKDNLPVECLQIGLAIIGVLASQAMVTLDNSFTYFERIQEDKLLTKIAGLYKNDKTVGVILECLTKFIHPTLQIGGLQQNGQTNSLLYAKVIGTFKSLKVQVAESLLKTQFISNKSPLSYFGQKRSYFVSYCEVLLQCLLCSKQFKKQFQKHQYWFQDLVLETRTRAFLMEYNSIFIRQDNQGVIPQKMMHQFIKKSEKNKLIKISVIEAGYLNLKNRQKKQYPNFIRDAKFLLENIQNALFIQNNIKEESIKEVYGSFSTTGQHFDEPLIKVFGDIVQNYSDSENEQIKNVCQNIFTSICNLNNNLKPTIASMYILTKMYCDSRVTKDLRGKKQIQSFFYFSLEDILKREQCQHFEIYFQESQIPGFIAKFIQCANMLIQNQDLGPSTNNLSNNAASLTKYIQSSSFYRLMFIQSLTEEQFYQHLKYSQRVISKTSQVDSEFINFLGVVVAPMCKSFVHSKNSDLLVEMFIILAQIARDYSQYNQNILESRIIRKFKDWLVEPGYSEYLKEKLLYFIGNLAKRSDFFFNQFEAYSVIQSIATCLSYHNKNRKILKNIIYSVGNVSYYSERYFCKNIYRFHLQMQPMIPFFAQTFQLQENHINHNLISTVSNLLRFSDVYLKSLLQTKLIENIINAMVESQQRNDPKLTLGLSVIKKLLPYYKDLGDCLGGKDLQAIYRKRTLISDGDNNEAIRKIKALLIKEGKNISAL